MLYVGLFDDEGLVFDEMYYCFILENGLWMMGWYYEIYLSDVWCIDLVKLCIIFW